MTDKMIGRRTTVTINAFFEGNLYTWDLKGDEALNFLRMTWIRRVDDAGYEFSASLMAEMKRPLKVLSTYSAPGPRKRDDDD